jgi:protein-disulfide isomerase
MVAVTVIAVGAAAYLLLRPLEGPGPDGVETHYAGLERGFTGQGFARLGSPDAPVVIEDFSSYACPHCRTFHEEQFEDLLDEIAAGEVQFVMIPIAHIGSGARGAAKGALCAGEQGRFWEMHDTLFYWQDKYLTSVFDERRIKLGAENLGLDVDAFEQCMASDRVDPVIDEARREFDRRGLTGTPTFFINGQRVQDYREIEELNSTS